MMHRLTQRIVITVDGLAGSGKTTLSRELAKLLGFAHFNSGILYRAVGFLALHNGVSPDDGAALAELISAHTIELDLDAQLSSQLIIDGNVRSGELHQPPVSDAASRVAASPEVRAALIDVQRSAFPGHNLVAEGRDMGTVIFPDANLKFFVDADLEVRTERRLAQLREAPENASKDDKLLKKELEVEINERDKRDIRRAVAPTVAADDAVHINNSGQTLTQVLQNMYDSVANRGLVR